VVSHGGLSRLSVLLASALLMMLLAGCDLPLLGQIMGTKPSTPAPPPKPVTLDLSSIATCTQPGTCQSCLMDAQWSPDGARFAILKSCYLGRGTDPNNAVLLFNAHTHSLVAQVTLQKTIVEEGKLPSVCAEGNGVNIQQTVNIDAREVVWTADSQRLAIPFEYWNYQPEEMPGYCAHGGPGVLLLNASGQLDRLLLRKDYHSETFTGWDLQTGEPVESDSLPAALSYRWGADGKLTPVDTLSTTGAPPATSFSHNPIGNPMGGATFSIWQSGSILLQEPTDQPSTQPPGAYDAYTFQSSFAAISPNGRYLTWSGAFGWMEPKGREQPSAHDLDTFGLTDLPRLPIRDAALQKALLHLPQNGSAGVAWRPDGQMLVMTVPNCHGICGPREFGEKSLRILRSDTGQIALELTPPQGDAAGKLRWSADGKYLLLVHERDAIIWDLSALK
jgi:hypothetical protein